MLKQDTLFAAYSRAYELEGKARILRLGIDAFLAVAAVVLAVAEIDAPVLAGIALTWLVVRELPVFTQPDDYRRRAVNIQEQFDCAFPGVEWNRALNGEPEQAHKIRALAASGSKHSLPANYWIDTDGLPDEVGALFRQAQSSLWGQEGHERYWKINAGVVGVGALGLGVLAWSLQLSFAGAVVAVFAPVAPLAVGRVQAARRHRSEALERKDMARTIENELLTAAPGLLPSSRFVQSIQGRLYRSRMSGGRIPKWLYDRFSESDRVSIDCWLEDQVSQVRERLRGKNG